MSTTITFTVHLEDDLGYQTEHESERESVQVRVTTRTKRGPRIRLRHGLQRWVVWGGERVRPQRHRRRPDPEWLEDAIEHVQERLEKGVSVV